MKTSLDQVNSASRQALRSSETSIFWYVITKMVCTLDGEYVTKFGTSGKETSQFCGPEAVAVLPSGEIVVTDKGN